jgi:hypothetical protein
VESDDLFIPIKCTLAQYEPGGLNHFGENRRDKKE